MRTFLLFFCIAVSFVWSQSLPLPPRPAGAPGGSALKTKLSSLSRAAREDSLYAMIAGGNIPDFLRSFVPVSVTKTINGTSYTLQFDVAPDYLAVGSNDDHVYMPMTPLLAQRIANRTDCTLPTAKMVDAIYTAAAVKLRPQPIPPDAEMINVPRFYQHNDSVHALRDPLLATFPLGALVGGTKKDVVIDKKVYSWIKGTVPKPVVIYGWHQLNGTPIQPTYNGHEETYADYSHGVRLVKRTARINGAEVSLLDILRDPVMFQLISDTVLVTPYYHTLTNVTGENVTAPTSFELEQNFPNPFNPSTQIRYTLAHPGHVQLTVSDATGREVATLVRGFQDRGPYAVHLDLAAASGVPRTTLASGAYFYTLQLDNAAMTKKMLLVK